MRLFIVIAFLAATAAATPTVKKLDGEAMTFPSGLLYKSMTGSNLKRGNSAMAPLFRRGKPEDHLVGRRNFWWVYVLMYRNHGQSLTELNGLQEIWHHGARVWTGADPSEDWGWILPCLVLLGLQRWIVWIVLLNVNIMSILYQWYMKLNSAIMMGARTKVFAPTLLFKTGRGLGRQMIGNLYTTMDNRLSEPRKGDCHFIFIIIYSKLPIC